MPIRLLASSERKTEGGPSEVLADSAASSGEALLSSDPVLFGVLTVLLGAIFYSASLKGGFWERFYRIVPVILLCYFLPSLLTLFGWVDSAASDRLYGVAKNYLLPASLVLLTLSVDLREVFRLGPKAVILFLTGTIGVVIGGPIAVAVTALVRPELVGGEGGEAVWRGLATVAGSWIGGGANQAAMKEIFQPSQGLYSAMIAVDVLVAEFWMVFLLLGVGKADAIDRWTGADASAVERLKTKMADYSQGTARVGTTADWMVLMATAFGAVAIAHAGGAFLGPWCAENVPQASRLSLNSSFFWLIVLATTIGVGLSFTPARKLEGVGASKLGTVFIFLLVAAIGLKMDLAAVVEFPGLFAVGLLWMIIHVGLMVVVAYFIKAPYFFLAVGSKANIGGAASAPVVAAAFHPSLAPVGVLLAVLGYALGTYGAWLAAVTMRAVSP
ncbi:MAG: DUF819 family protein [Planctomycetota bacterium]